MDYVETSFTLVRGKVLCDLTIKDFSDTISESRFRLRCTHMLYTYVSKKITLTRKLKQQFKMILSKMRFMKVDIGISKKLSVQLIFKITQI